MMALLGALASPSLAHADDVESCVGAAERAQDLRARHHLREAHEALLVCARSACP